MRNNILKNKDGSQTILNCRCGCENGLKVSYWYDGDVSLSWIESGSSKEYESGLYRIWEKIKRIWAIIRNKEYAYAEIIISMDEWHEFLNDEIGNYWKRIEEKQKKN